METYSALTNYKNKSIKIKIIKVVYKKFKTGKSFYLDGPIKSHTPRFPAVDKEAIQRNFLCKLLSSFSASTKIAESN